MRGMDESEENGLPFGAMEPQLRKKPGWARRCVRSGSVCDLHVFVQFWAVFFLQYRLNANEWMDGQTLL